MECDKLLEDEIEAETKMMFGPLNKSATDFIGYCIKQQKIKLNSLE